MAEPLTDQIIRKFKQAAKLYHRLMIVIAPAGAGKTTALQNVRERTGAALVNVNLLIRHISKTKRNPMRFFYGLQTWMMNFVLHLETMLLP